jgi:hypothetical protein
MPKVKEVQSRATKCNLAGPTSATGPSSVDFLTRNLVMAVPLVSAEGVGV